MPQPDVKLDAFAPRTIWGLLVGIHFAAGGIFSGDYYIAEWEPLQQNPTARPRDVRIHRVREFTVPDYSAHGEAAERFPLAAWRRKMETTVSFLDDAVPPPPEAAYGSKEDINDIESMEFWEDLDLPEGLLDDILMPPAQEPPVQTEVPRDSGGAGSSTDPPRPPVPPLPDPPAGPPAKAKVPAAPRKRPKRPASDHVLTPPGEHPLDMRGTGDIFGDRVVRPRAGSTRPPIIIPEAWSRLSKLQKQKEIDGYLATLPVVPGVPAPRHRDSSASSADDESEPRTLNTSESDRNRESLAARARALSRSSVLDHFNPEEEYPPSPLSATQCSEWSGDPFHYYRTDIRYGDDDHIPDRYASEFPPTRAPSMDLDERANMLLPRLADP